MRLSLNIACVLKTALMAGSGMRIARIAIMTMVADALIAGSNFTYYLQSVFADNRVALEF